jgi:CheY-like chemotaxis protein
MMPSINKILLVEDEAIIAMSLRGELSRAGYTVCGTVASGEEAIAFIEQELPELILMDINLAGNLDGLETAKRICDRHKTPIIFMSGYDEIEIQQPGPPIDHAKYVEKPVEIHHLKQLIESI